MRCIVSNMAQQLSTVQYINRIPSYVPKYKFSLNHIPSPYDNPFMSYQELSKYEAYVPPKPLTPEEENIFNTMLDKDTHLQEQTHMWHNLSDHARELQIAEQRWRKQLRNAQRWEYDRSYAESRKLHLEKTFNCKLSSFSLESL